MRLKLVILSITILASFSAMHSENSYEWLENTEDLRTQNWLKQQESHFQEYISSDHLKDELKASLKNLTNSDTNSIPSKGGNHYFYLKRKPSEKLDVLYIQKGIDGIPQALIDPNSSETESFSIESFVVSPDGNYLAYGTSEKGSDWITYRVMNIHSQLSTVDAVEKIFELKQIFYDSKDGTKVPMFIAHKKGIKLGGNNKVLLTGYEAYGFTNYPIFNPVNMVWLDRGGIFALANIRGGSEFGENWYKAVIRENKQNSFDDFIGAAEWLVANNYTKPARLASIGMSSGGLLVAASANQRPELFGAMVVEAGLLDILRFHLFTVGHFWINEHGNPENPDDFEYLKKYSPCHNVRKGVKYPAILVTTSKDDERVVPSHIYKYLAALQDTLKNNEKVLLRVSANVGHDSSKSSDWLDEKADILKFIIQELEYKFWSYSE